MTEKTLSEKAFTTLANDLQQILTTAQQASSDEKVVGYWTLGGRIKRARIDRDLGYHNTVLRELSHVLGVAQRTLQYSLAFHEYYPRVPRGSLGWGHYKVLCSVPRKVARTFYEKATIKNAWSTRELQRAIRAGLYEGGTPQSVELDRPTSPGYIYRAKNPRLVDADTLDLEIDLGFQCWTVRRVRLAQIDAPEASSPAGRAALNYLKTQLKKASTLTIRSTKVDDYGRYLADLFVSATPVSLEDCYLSGTHLNALLVSSGHAAAV